MKRWFSIKKYENFSTKLMHEKLKTFRDAKFSELKDKRKMCRNGKRKISLKALQKATAMSTSYFSFNSALLYAMHLFKKIIA